MGAGSVTFVTRCTEMFRVIVKVGRGVPAREPGTFQATNLGGWGLVICAAVALSLVEAKRLFDRLSKETCDAAYLLVGV